MPLTQFGPVREDQEFLQFDHTATPGAWVTLALSQTYDAIVLSLVVSNSDTIDHNLVFAFNNSGDRIVGGATIPAGSGYTTIAPFDWLARLVGSTNPFLWWINNSDMYVQLGEAINSPHTVDVYAQVGFPVG